MSQTKNIPTCIGIIPDGNRRWAKERGLPAFEGHRQGINALERAALSARDFGIKHTVVYAFSTENWGRPAEEVSYLMDLFEEMAKKFLERLGKENVGVRFVGQLGRLSEKLQNAMQDAEEKSPKNPDLTLWIGLSCGGRADIVQAANSLAKESKPITEDSLAGRLWAASMPNPDLIIRTSGEQRISNFMLWQGAYSELFFPKVYWPEFTKDNLELILKEYAERERRIGR